MSKFEDSFLDMLYKKNFNNSARFVLGEKGKKPLACFGINASTARPGDLDPTVGRVASVSLQGFDGWIMLNIYPQRSTDPCNLHPMLDEKLHKRNICEIKDILCGYPSLTIWAAWGNLIELRPYLKKCLVEIVKVLKPYSFRWVYKGELTKKGHPRHPLYLRSDLPFHSFDIDNYIKKF